MRRVATPLALAIVTAVAVAVLLLLAAFDVQRWSERVVEDDVRFGTPAAADLWKPATLLPGDPVERCSASATICAMRSSRSSRRTRASPRSSIRSSRRRASTRRCSRARRRGGDEPRARSELINLLGALSTSVAPRQEQQRRVESLDAAAAYFTEAVRLDRTNKDAMYNLEVVLRRLQDEPWSFESPGGRLPRDEASMGGPATPAPVISGSPGPSLRRLAREHAARCRVLSRART